jgi:predicted nucleic acid-binding protein
LFSAVSEKRLELVRHVAGAVLVTNNEKHFRRVEGLKVENWA